MLNLTDHELQQIERSNASGRRPVVFIHGLCLLPSSWNRWRTYFEERGYATISPGWPDDPDTVAAAREHPQVFAGKSIGDVADHYLNAIARLTAAPVIIGHSFGGLIAQRLAGEGVAEATVAIAPAPFRGVLPLPLSSLRSAAPVLRSPANYARAVTLTFEQFAYGWANALEADEARELYERYHVAAGGRPLFSAATANLNPWSDDRVDTRRRDRGPLLFVAGAEDNTVPRAIVAASCRRQAQNAEVTDLVTVPRRGHSLTIDHGWEFVAELAFEFASTHAPALAR
ncbi:alpha/beta fold hydrolase [soil metagenome]